MRISFLALMKLFNQEGDDVVIRPYRKLKGLKLVEVTRLLGNRETGEYLIYDLDDQIITDNNSVDWETLLERVKNVHKAGCFTGGA